MNRRKAATVRRVVQNKANEENIEDDDITTTQDEVSNKEKHKSKQSKSVTNSTDGSTNEVIVAVDIHNIPKNGKDDNQNYIPESGQNGTQAVVEVKNKAVNEKKKGGLNAVLARLSPLKKQMKAALALKATKSATVQKNKESEQNNAPGSVNGLDEIEVLEEDVDGVTPIVITPSEEAKKKKRRPSVKAALAKKGEAMKPSTKIALKAKIKQKVTPKSSSQVAKNPILAQSLSPVVLPPAPVGFVESSPLAKHSTLGTCFLLPVKQEPLDNEDINSARLVLRERLKKVQDDSVAPLDLSMSKRDESLNSSSEEMMESEGEVMQEAESDAKKASPSKVLTGSCKKRKQTVTPGGKNKRKKTQETPDTESTPLTPASKTPKSPGKGLPVVMFSAKKTARKSIRDPTTPSPVKCNSQPGDSAESPPKEIETNEAHKASQGVILNTTKLEGSNRQIVVKQENNEIVIRIEADQSIQSNNADEHEQSIMDLTMSPQSSMKIASVVNQAVRAAASKAQLNMSTSLITSDEETDENAKVNDNSPAAGKPGGKVEKPKECPICGKVFNRGGNLVGHMRKHTGERPYVCDICQKGFTFLTNLRAHMNVHTGERPYKCKECDKAYTQLCGLQRHMASHSDAKPFVCGTCQKAFKHVHVLRRHELVHGEYRPYQCLTCGKGFLHAWHLEKHVRVHTGERPFKCPQCDGTFTQKSGLQAHINRVHLNLPEDTATLSEEEEEDETTTKAPSGRIEETKDGSTENLNNNDPEKSVMTNDENGNKIITGNKHKNGIDNVSDKENKETTNMNKKGGAPAENANKSTPKEVIIGMKDLANEPKVIAEIIKIEPEED